jgi:hypothetical protein
MTAPEPDETRSDDQNEVEVPPASPAYATPPPEGPPDADRP